MVHEVVFHVGAIWLTVLVGATIAMMVRSDSMSVRILMLDLLTILIVGLLLLYATSYEVEFLIDVALAVAILSFLGTLAAARYYGRGSLFR